jgi:N-methylhydantoinase B
MTVKADTGDFIAEELLRMSLRRISMEMASTLKRMSGSPIITEADDYTVLLYSPRGELLDCPMGPIYSGPGGMSMQKFLAEFGPDGFADGDVFLANDPFSTGALHANDMQVIVPVFVDQTCVGFAYMHAHVMDVGGIMPGSWGVGATDCFGEAFRLPFVKYSENGKINQMVRKIVAVNTRLPDMVLSDIQSMATAAQVGAARLKELVASHGANRYAALVADMLDRTERAARTRVGLLKPGVHEAVNWIEHNGHRNDLYGMRGRLTVEPGRLLFEFTGDPQTNGFVNATRQAVVAKVAAATAPMLFWDIPMNEGVRRVLEVRSTPGTVVCANEPAAVSAGHVEGGLKLVTVITKLVSAAMRESDDAEIASRAHAAFADSVDMATFAGLDHGGDYHVVFDNTGLSGGTGGGPGVDGLDVGGPLPATAISIPDIESLEADYPIMFLWRRLGRDSGGAGEFRGGVGLDGAWTLTEADTLMGNNVAATWQIPAVGAEGGFPGAATKAEIVTDIDVAGDWIAHGRLPSPDQLPDGRNIEAKAIGIEIRGGQVWRLRTPGGGGWGDPLARDPDAVARDVAIGAVTLAAAAAAYGVVLAPGTLEVDIAATEALRGQRRAARLEQSAETSSTARPFAAGRDKPCRYCGGLRAGCLSPQPLSETLAGFGAFVQPRDGVELAQSICPDCASLTHVALTVRDPVPEIPAPDKLVRLL